MSDGKREMRRARSGGSQSRQGARALAVLAFHKVGEPPPRGRPTWFYVPEDTYLAQLRYLHDQGWQVIDLQTFLIGLDSPGTLPDRAALLTFDDGYRSFLDGALRGLRDVGFPAVLFVPTQFIGGLNTFDAGVEPEEEMCDWDGLRRMEQSAVSVQSHGVSHRRLSDLSPAEQEAEVSRSKAVLEQGLGRPVEVFSYPYGDCGTETVVRSALRRAGYRAAFLYGGGVNRLPLQDRYRIARVAMGPDTDLGVELDTTLDSKRPFAIPSGPQSPRARLGADVGGEAMPPDDEGEG